MKNITSFLIFVNVIFLMIVTIPAVKAASDLPTGDYTISSGANTEYNVDLQSGRIQNGSNIQIYKENTSYAQIWYIEKQEDGYYKIALSKNKTYLLTVQDGTFKTYGNVVLKQEDGSNSQKWKIKETEDGYYIIESYDRNYVLDLMSGVARNYGNIQICQKNGTNAQKYAINKKSIPGEKVIDNGLYNIINKASSKVIDTDTKITFLNDVDNNSRRQLWYIEYLNNGYYLIKSFSDERYVFNVTNSLKSINSSIGLSLNNKSNEEQWLIKEAEDGYYKIISKHNGFSIDFNSSLSLKEEEELDSQKFRFISRDEPNIANLPTGDYTISSGANTEYNVDLQSGRIQNGSNIQIYKENTSYAQIWYIEKQEDGYYRIALSKNKTYLLTVQDGTFKTYGNVVLKQEDGSNSQKWKIKETEDGYYIIESYDRNYVLDLMSGVARNYGNIQICQKNGTNAQKYAINKKSIPGEKVIDNGLYTITNATSTAFIDESNGLQNHSQLFMNSNESDSEKLYIRYLNNGYYSIKPINNVNYSFNLTNRLKSKNIIMEINNNRDSDEQQFLIKETGDGNYNIISKYNGYAFTIDNNYKIKLDTLFNNENQKFKFNKIDSYGTQEIKDGYYFINLKLDRNKSIEIANGYIKNGQNVQVYSSNSTVAQKWHFKYVGNGYYTILTNNDEYALTSSNNYYGNVSISKYNDLSTQKWIVKKNSNGYYSIINSSLSSIDITGGNPASGNNVQLCYYNMTDAQQFKLIPTAAGKTLNNFKDGYYFISSALNDNYVIDLSGGNTTNNNNVWLMSSNRSDAQKWYFNYSGNGYYNITSGLNIFKSLDVTSGGLSNGTNLQIYDYNNLYTQQWVLQDAGDGYYYIASNCNGLYLTVAAQEAGNGANINLSEFTGNTNQKFKLTYTRLEKLVIDVSAHNGNINWQQVHEQGGIYGAILRVAAGAVHEDTQLSNNVAGVKQFNIPYGIYIYSYGENYDEGVIYGNYINSIISKYSLQPTIGIYLDLERNNITSYMNPDQYTELVKGFKSVVPNAQLYTYKNYAETALNNEYLQSLITWIAQYNSQCTYGGKYNIWQYTSDGTIPGISGRVDLNILYKDK